MKTESTLDPGSALQEGERIFARAWKLLVAAFPLVRGTRNAWSRSQRPE